MQSRNDARFQARSGKRDTLTLSFVRFAISGKSSNTFIAIRSKPVWRRSQKNGAGQAIGIMSRGAKGRLLLILPSFRRMEIISCGPHHGGNGVEVVAATRVFRSGDFLHGAT